MKRVEKVKESREQGTIIFGVAQHEAGVLDCKEQRFWSLNNWAYSQLGFYSNM